MKECIQTFVVCVVSLLSLIIIGRGLQMRELFLNLDVGPLDIGLLFLYMVPMFLLMVVPISCMVSVFLTFLRMSSDRELIAMKAGGVSIFQMLLAPFIFSVVCMFLAFFVSLHGISWGMTNFRIHILEIANTKAKIVVQPGVFNQDLFGKTLFAKKVDPETGALHQVIFEDKDKNNDSTIIFLAPQGEITTNEEKGELQFKLFNGKVYRIAGSASSIVSFEEYTAVVDLSKLLTGVDLEDIRPKEMSWNDLISMSHYKTAPSSRYQHKVSVEIQKRLALPVACLVLGIFAIPVACSFEGVRRQVGVIVALVMFLVYYSIFSIGLSTGETGKLPPVIGLWMANVIFAIIAAVGLYIAGKERLNIIQNTLLNVFGRLRFLKRRQSS